MENSIVPCPICKDQMELKNQYDGIKILKCTNCKCEVHFSGWEQQREIIELFKGSGINE